MNAPGNTLQPVAGTELSLSIVGSRISSDTLKVYRVTGYEAISKPFRYEIELVREGGDLTTGAVLGKDATLEIKVTDGSATMPGDEMVRRVHGVVEEFMDEESVDGEGATQNHYRVVLVPRLAMLARNRQNRIHATSDLQTLEQIIRHKLLSSGPDYEPLSADPNYAYVERDNRVVLEDDEFRIDIDADGVPLQELSHVAQYDETDLDFIRRLCESHGVYFFFASNAGDSESEDTRGMVVFANTNTAFGVIRFNTEADGDTYEEEHKLDIDLVLTGASGLGDGSTYEAADGGPAEHTGALSEFKSVHRPVPAGVNVIADRRVQSKDELGNVTTLDLKQTATLEGGSGIYSDYDTHFCEQTVGDAFAAVRSQELRAASNYCVGCTSSPCVAPGRTFTKKPPSGSTDPDKKFLVTAVDIEVTHAHAQGMVDIDGEVIQTGISNRFRCIEFDDAGDSVYRPPRVTPRPHVDGVHTAYIGTGVTGVDGRPVLDAEGAYRIYNRFADERVGFVDAKEELAFDKLSKAVRKGEPYAGEGVGMHFALKRDTEVLVAYRNGDPDRPVIAAAMPGSPDDASPVTDDNPTSHVIETSSGARFEIHDDDHDSKARIALQSRAAIGKASYVRLGKADTANASVPETLEDEYEKEKYVVVEANETRDGIALYTAGTIREATQKDRITEAQGSVRVHAEKDIHGRSVQTHLLRGRRMVIFSGEAKDEPGEGATVDIGDSEVSNEVSFEAGDMLLSSKGNVYIKADEDIHTTVLKSVTTEVDGDEINRTSGDTVSHHYGNTQSIQRGASTSFVLGASTNVRVGFAGLAVFGGWLRPWGPLSGRLYVGFAYYLWPQAFILQGTVTLTNLVFDCKTAAYKVVKTNLSCKTSIIRHRLASTNVQNAANVSILGANHNIL